MDSITSRTGWLVFASSIIIFIKFYAIDFLKLFYSLVGTNNVSQKLCHQDKSEFIVYTAMLQQYKINYHLAWIGPLLLKNNSSLQSPQPV